jgi:phosphohistidine phosphatase
MTPAREGRTLVLVRHAKSDWSGGHPDRERPLAERGRRQAPEAGRWLRAGVGEIHLAVVSPAERARRTWELVSAELDASPPVREEDRVYAAAADDLLELVRELPEDLGTVVLVGHNPGVEELVLLLTGEAAAMKTSAVAVIDLPGAWGSAGDSLAKLRAAGRPPAG